MQKVALVNSTTAQHTLREPRLGARCTSLTKWLTFGLTIWLSVNVLQETLTLG